MILPPEPCAIICLAASCVHTITPQALTRTIESKFSSSISMKLRGRFIPALLKITLSAPKLSTAFWIMAWTCTRSVTSTPTDTALPPLATIASATACAADASRSATTTFAPSAATAWHVAAPIPPAPPVTITTRSCTRPISIPLTCSDSRGLAFEQVCSANVRLAADEQLVRGELRDDAVPRRSDDDLLLDASCGFTVARGAVRLEREDHTLLDLDRVLERVDTRDHRRLVEADAEAVAELQAEAGLLVGEAELLRRRPDARDLVGRATRAHELDGHVEPLAALLVGVQLRLRDAADVEGAVVAGAVAHEGVDDVEEGLVAGSQEAVAEDVGVGVAAVAGDGVDGFDLLGAELEQALHGHGHDLMLAHAWAEHAVDVLVDRVDDRCGVLEQRDLIRGLERAGAHHHRLCIARLDALAVQREQRLHVGQVDSQRIAGDPAIRELAVDASGQSIGHAGLARHRAAHRGHPRLPARLRQPRRIQLVVLRRRAEVPEHGVALARQQHAARALVARPLADVRARDVADVVLIEQQHRAQVRL